MKLLIVSIAFNVFSQFVLAETDTKKLAVTCFACHGEAGVSPNNLWPNLAGQKKDYLLKALHDFHLGSRKNELMSPMVQTLSDSDMEQLATYFSGLKAP